jgi:phosphoribosylanthranilate isomerase
MLFRVKICGVTTPADARMIAAAGADAIGLNFVSGSPRALDVEQARAVAAQVPPGVLKVGVFAGTAAAEIRRIVAAVGLEAVQLHGHPGGDGPAVDPPARCAELAGLTVIRALRLEPGGQAGRSPHVGRPSRLRDSPHDAARSPDPLAAARLWLAEAAALGAVPAAVIIDAATPRETPAGHLGGTGARVDWATLATCRPLGPPTALAGGLTPDNVALAIRVSGAAAVDAASGVESQPGRKDPEKVRAFVVAARAELALSAKCP